MRANGSIPEVGRRVDKANKWLATELKRINDDRDKRLTRIEWWGAWSHGACSMFTLLAVLAIVVATIKGLVQ